MKKILLISTILIAGITFAQNSKFIGNYSTKSLDKIQKSVPENEKHEFYKQYLRAKISEDMNQIFTYKKYPKIILEKFSDSIIAAYSNSEEVLNTDKIDFIPSETFDQFLENHNKYISQNENSVRKEENDILGKLPFLSKEEKEKLLKKYIDDRLRQIQEEKNKTPEILKSEYATKIKSERDNFENDPSTSRGLNKIIVKIDQEFQNSKKSDDFQFLLESNLNSDLASGNSNFPSVTSNAEESAIYETIPGDILTYVTENGFAAGRHFYSYKIIGNEIKPIQVLGALENETFAKKISKYIKGNWRYEDRAGYDITKQKNGDYLITTNIYLDSDANNFASKIIEYKTKDFKTFTPVRIADNEENSKWKLIK